MESCIYKVDSEGSPEDFPGPGSKSNLQGPADKILLPNRGSRGLIGTKAIAEKPPIVLTIAGFDPSSGAGVTADIKTIAEPTDAMASPALQP